MLNIPPLQFYVYNIHSLLSPYSSFMVLSEYLATFGSQWESPHESKRSIEFFSPAPINVEHYLEHGLGLSTKLSPDKGLGEDFFCDFSFGSHSERYVIRNVFVLCTTDKSWKWKMTNPRSFIALLQALAGLHICDFMQKPPPFTSGFLGICHAPVFSSDELFTSLATWGSHRCAEFIFHDLLPFPALEFIYQDICLDASLPPQRASRQLTFGLQHETYILPLSFPPSPHRDNW